MKEAIADFLSSKKALAFLATMLVVIGNKIVGHWGYELDATQVSLLVGTAAAYILGQGIADHGKSAAEINQQTVMLQMPVQPKPASPPQAGFVRLGLMLMLAAIAAFAVACGSSAAQKRESTIKTTLAALDAASASFEAYQGQHQLDIVSQATSHDEGVAKLAEFRKKRDEVEHYLIAAYLALKAAASLDDDPSLSSALAAVMQVQQALATIGVKP